MQISALIIFTLVVVFPLSAASEVKVTLKNGREVIADSCRDSNGRLVCEKMGGNFELDKKDILDVKGITIEHPGSYHIPVEGTGKETESGGKGPVKPEAETKGPDKKPEGALVKGLNPEDEKRLDQINRKKIEYQAERQRLLNERQQLNEDIKNSGVIGSKEKYEEMQKRIKDLDEKVNKFNDAVKKLNEEGKKILEGAQ
jgi:tetrahydromethanopterin S-methyltransferase subunit G